MNSNIKICSICSNKFKTEDIDNKICPSEFCQTIWRRSSLSKCLPRRVKKITESLRDLYLRLFESEVEIKEKISEIRKDERWRI